MLFVIGYFVIGLILAVSVPFINKNTCILAGSTNHEIKTYMALFTFLWPVILSGILCGVAVYVVTVAVSYIFDVVISLAK